MPVRKENTKEIQADYTIKILCALQEGLFGEESSHAIDRQELLDPDRARQFIYALSVLAPAMVLENLTGNSMSALEFNHLCNRLVMQNSEFDK
jgi:hypothetical protein